MITFGEALFGGLYAGTSTTAVWWTCSMIPGHANMVGHVFRGDIDNKHLFARRITYILGLIVAGFIMTYGYKSNEIGMDPVSPFPWWYYLISGLLLGFGSQIAGGCTLGGVPFGSTRSIMSFVIFAIAAFAICNWASGGWQFVVDGGKPQIDYVSYLSAGSVGLLIGVYFIFMAAYAVSAVLKKRVNSVLGSLLIMLVAGTQFGMGLGLGGMLQQEKVLSSIDLQAYWDPSVWIFLATSLLVTIIGVQIVRKVGFFSADEPPESVAVTDMWLVLGALMVGASFGLVGLILGSALTMIPRMFESVDNLKFLGIFLASTLVGVWAHYLVSRAVLRSVKQP